MTHQMKANLIFNPKGQDDVAHRTIIKWNTTGLFQLNVTKYSWAKSLYQVMVWNFWLPEKVSGLGEDANQFKKELTADEQREGCGKYRPSIMFKEIE